MSEADYEAENPQEIPVVDLSDRPGTRESWDRSALQVYLWAICELLFVYNPWQISSSIRVRVLRAFGAEIDAGVLFRPRTRVRFPWKLHIGARSWIGEGVWLHCQDHIYIGEDAVVSQDSLLTTGSHAHRKDMSLLTRPIVIEDGAWITARCVVLGGVTIGRSALIQPMTLVSEDVPSNTIFGTAKAGPLGTRFPPTHGDHEAS